MRSTLIEDFMRINAEINYNYRDSKLPKFIKNIIVERRRDRLRKFVKENFGNQDDKSSTLIDQVIEEYLYYIGQMYPPFGKYKDCIRVGVYDENSKTGVTATFEFKDVLPNVNIVMTFGNNGKNNSFIIGYTVVSDGVRTYQFATEAEYLSDMKRYNNPKPWSQEQEQEAYSDYCTKYLLENISSFLNDTIERSERINSNE